MLATGLAVLANLWPIILGIVAGLLLLWNKWLRTKNQAQRRTIEEQENAIQVHETIEDIHQQDTQIDQGVDDRIDELEGEIAGQPPEDQAGKIGDALDGYFDSDKK